MSESRATATSRFVSTYAGAGVHHIALSTPSAIQTALQFEDSAVPLLSIPVNYFDDLAARLEIDDITLAGLQRHGLLYDRDGEGDFLHFYTDSFQDRFFFEVVERRGGYGGFGAANTQVRATAQARQHPAATPWL